MFRRLFLSLLCAEAIIAGAIDGRPQQPLQTTADIWEQISNTAADKPRLLNVTLEHSLSGAKLSYRNGRVTAYQNTTHRTPANPLLTATTADASELQPRPGP